MAPLPFGHTVLDLVHKQGCCTRSDSEVQLQAVLIILPFWYHFAQTTWQLLNEYFSFHGFSFHDFGKLEAQNEAAASAVGSLNPIIAVKTRVQKAIGMPWAWDCMCFVYIWGIDAGGDIKSRDIKKTWISYDFLVYPAVSTSSGSNKVLSNLQADILVLCVLCPLPIH